MFSIEQLARQTERRDEGPVDAEHVDALAVQAQHGGPAPIVKLAIEIAAQVAARLLAINADGERKGRHARHRATRNAEPLNGPHLTMFGDGHHRSGYPLLEVARAGSFAERRSLPVQ